MRQVDQHADPVHLVDYFPAERTQSVPPFPDGGRIGYLIVAVMGKGDITHTGAMEEPQKGERLLDRGTVFHPDEYADQSFFLVRQRLPRSQGEGGLVRSGI